MANEKILNYSKYFLRFFMMTHMNPNSHTTHTILLRHKKNLFPSFTQFQKIIAGKIRNKFGDCDVFVSQQPRLAVHVIFKNSSTNQTLTQQEVQEAVLEFTQTYVMTGM
jgi:hypothetical protein